MGKVSDHLTVSMQRKHTIKLFLASLSFSLSSCIFFSTLEVSNSFWNFLERKSSTNGSTGEIRRSPLHHEPICLCCWPSPWIRLVNIFASGHKDFNCPPSRLQILPSFQRQLTNSSLAKYYGQVGDINSHLIWKLIDVLLRLRNFLGGWEIMSIGRWQGVYEETSLTLPSWKRLIIALTSDLAGKGLSGMHSNAAWNDFNSRMLLTLPRTARSLSSLCFLFHSWSL